MARSGPGAGASVPHRLRRRIRIRAQRAAESPAVRWLKRSNQPTDIPSPRLRGPQRPGAAHHRVTDQRRPSDVVGQRLQPVFWGKGESLSAPDGNELHRGDQDLIVGGRRPDIDAMAAEYAGQLVIPGGAAGAGEAEPTQFGQLVELEAVGVGKS